MGINSLAAKASALAARTVHLKLFPTPTTFNERREVLRVLERFGEVTMFKSLKYRALSPIHNAFVATFANEASAAQARNAAPIRYFLVSEENNVVNDAATAELSQVEASQQSSNTATFSPPASSSTSDYVNETSPHDENSPSSEFHLEVYPSTLQHDKYIQSPHTNPLYGPYTPLTSSRSPIAGMLKDNIPASMWARGLRDWETDEERWRVANASESQLEDGEGWTGRVLGRVGAWSEKSSEEEEQEMGVPSVARVAYTQAVNRRRKAIPKIMWGLRAFKEEKEREAEEVKGRMGVE